MQSELVSLTHRFLLVGCGARAAGRTLDSIAQLADVDFQLGNCPAQGVAVHIELTGGAALVSFVLLQNGQDETLFEFAHGLGIKNVALVHLHNERFELISHVVSLSKSNVFVTLPTEPRR